MSIHKRTFEYGEWLDLVAKTPAFRGASRNVEHRGRGRFTWAGTATYAEAMDLTRKGWADGLKDIKDLSEKIWSVVGQEIQKTSFFYDVAGCQPDIDRYLAGEPENMIQFVSEKEQAGKGKIVKVFVNNVASSGITTAAMFGRGAAVVALVDALENLGFSCEVMTADAIASTWRGDKEILQYEVMLKRAGQSLDLDRLAFALAHPCWLRRLVFCAMEQESPEIRRMFGVGANYGCPAESRGLTSDERGIEVPSLRYGEQTWTDLESATAWVLDAAGKVLGRPVSQTA